MTSKPKELGISAGINDRARCCLLQLSDELLLLIGKAVLANGDLGNFRLACKKLRDVTEDDMFHDVVLSLSEVPWKRWRDKLQNCLPQISKVRAVTILNSCQPPSSPFYKNTILQKNTDRIARWIQLNAAAASVARELDNEQVNSLGQFFQNSKSPANQLTSFRWRHAVPLTIEHLTALLSSNAQSLEVLEISMLKPMSLKQAQDLESELVNGQTLSKLSSFTYRGLSHTEPLAINNPERGGRFRMLRPILRQTYKQLQELRLSQDHCISQIGCTPLNLNGRTLEDTLCDLEELIWGPEGSLIDLPESLTLNLSKLELGGFQVRSLADKSNPVQLDLSRLRELSLANCDGLGNLFIELMLRREEISLKTFAVRYFEHKGSEEDAWDVATNMYDFLKSFKGLEVLSILWYTSNESFGADENPYDEIISQHSATIQVYVIDSQRPFDLDADSSSPDYAVASREETSAWGLDPINISNAFRCLNLREFAFNIRNNIEDFATVKNLRLLSRYHNLRTVHIRNFPAIQDLFTEPQPLYWRGHLGQVHLRVIEAVNRFAEDIALPTYEINCEDLFGEPLSSQLKSLVDFHVGNRSKELFGRSDLYNIPQQHTPANSDLAEYVIGLREEIDSEFAAVFSRVNQGAASESDTNRYKDIIHSIRTALRLEKPTVTEMPKLRLLIVGDWSYRDQMNLTGPRSWNPCAWSQPEEMEYSDDAEMDETEEEYMLSDGICSDPDLNFERHFQGPWDPRVRPIFFEINWKAKKGGDGKYRWKAQAKVLPHMTLEGQKPLSDVRSLQYAW